jgi:hypothetical protein
MEEDWAEGKLSWDAVLIKVSADSPENSWARTSWQSCSKLAWDGGSFAGHTGDTSCPEERLTLGNSLSLAGNLCRRLTTEDAGLPGVANGSWRDPT